MWNKQGTYGKSPYGRGSSPRPVFRQPPRWPSDSPQAANKAWSGMKSPNYTPSCNSLRKAEDPKKKYLPRETLAKEYARGTGAHDDALTKSNGNYRHPSLRRDSGLVVETPREMRKNIDMRKSQGQWPQQQASSPMSSPRNQGPSNREPEARTKPVG